MCALPGLACNIGADCTSGFCLGDVCVSCTNREKDGDESDVDCGGLTCDACDDAEACIIDGDCASGSCVGETGSKVCVSCSNGEQDGTESGEDCGGAQCDRTCSVGDFCFNNDDCSSNRCSRQSPPAGTCLSPTPDVTCADGAQGEQETCEDGGGVECVAVGQLCADDASCARGADCTSGLCYEEVCVSCSNGAQDGDETGEDCGGATCSPCDDGLACSTNDDCTSGSCIASLCVSCSNEVMDGDEVAMDCGFQACGVGCATDATCVVNADCLSGNCVAGSPSSTCRRPAPDATCADGVQGELETCVDGGGAECVGVGQLCSAATALSCTATTGASEDEATACGEVTELDDDTACVALTNCAYTADAAGEACVRGSDCESGSCREEVCISCTNGVKDGDESDVDCGGATCEGCGEECNNPGFISNCRCGLESDCRSGHCQPFGIGVGICVSCNNGVRDGIESDVDCGHVCDNQCGDGLVCMDRNDDCASGDCRDGRCYTETASDTCQDGAMGQLETCVDGGGAACTPLGYGCGDGASCEQGSDCTSGLCFRDSDAELEVPRGTCYSCTNEESDGPESGVDCGGGTCPTCADGGGCIEAADCQSSSCVDGTCVSCSNGETDGGESDVDCGAGCPDSLCGIDSLCTGSTDCASGNCVTADDGASACQLPAPETTCADSEQGEYESGVDCGGEQCAALGLRCADGVGCHESRDCASGLCYNTICVSCTNGGQDGDETDADCGGTLCEACEDGGACGGDGDCASEVCFDGACVSHENGVQDGDETDVDCGGAAPPCDTGATCTGHAGCVSGICREAVCVEPQPADTCTNLGQDGRETCLDGGGADCVPLGMLCGWGEGCGIDADCVTGSRCGESGSCSSCHDESQGEDETDVDCGGVCDACGEAGGCASSADCQDGLICFGDSHAVQVCYQPADITLAAVGEAISVPPGEAVLNSIWIDAGSGGAATSCIATVVLSTPDTTMVTLPPISDECPGSKLDITYTAANSATLVGSPFCINQQLAQIAVDTTCGTLWDEVRHCLSLYFRCHSAKD